MRPYTHVERIDKYIVFRRHTGMCGGDSRGHTTNHDRHEPSNGYVIVVGVTGEGAASRSAHGCVRLISRAPGPRVNASSLLFSYIHMTQRRRRSDRTNVHRFYILSIVKYSCALVFPF